MFIKTCNKNTSFYIVLDIFNPSAPVSNNIFPVPINNAPQNKNKWSGHFYSNIVFNIECEKWDHLTSRMKTNNVPTFIILLYFTIRKPFRQCNSQKFDYLKVLFTRLYTRSSKKSSKIKKKSLPCSEINPVCSRPYHSQGKTHICNTSLSRLKKWPWWFRTSFPYLSKLV